MLVIEIHGNLINKKKLLEEDLKRIEEDIDNIDAKYDSLGSAQLDPTPKPAYNTEPDKKYINKYYELNEKVDVNGNSLRSKQRLIQKELDKINLHIKRREATLKELKGREYRLYTLIVIDGLSPTKAVEQLAKEEGLIDTTNIWKREYKKIKKKL